MIIDDNKRSNNAQDTAHLSHYLKGNCLSLQKHRHLRNVNKITHLKSTQKTVYHSSGIADR